MVLAKREVFKGYRAAGSRCSSCDDLILFHRLSIVGSNGSLAICHLVIRRVDVLICDQYKLSTIKRRIPVGEGDGSVIARDTGKDPVEDRIICDPGQDLTDLVDDDFAFDGSIVKFHIDHRIAVLILTNLDSTFLGHGEWNGCLV